MGRERLKNSNSAPITWQGDKGVTLRVHYEAMGTGEMPIFIAREFHIRFGEPCPVLATIAGESPATTRNLITTLQDYSRQRPLTKRQDVTLRWIVGQLERSFLWE